MRGLPKILQTREDFDLALSMARAGEISASAVRNHFVGLIESSHRHEFSRELLPAEAGDGVEPDFFITEATDHDPVRRQLKRTIDPDARLFKLGFTLPEVQAIITELGVK